MRTVLRRSILSGASAVLAVAMAVSLFAQPARVATPRLTSPEKFFGHQIGADYVLPNYTKFTEYVRLLDKESDRMVVQSIGKTAEGRDQLMAIITAPENFAKLEIINTWEIAQYAKLLQKLKNTPDGETNLLDNMVVYLSAEISDGNAHNHDDLPVLLAGKLGGAITPGRHLKVPDKTPLANLFISIAEAFDVPTPSFGDDSTGPLAGLKV